MTPALYDLFQKNEIKELSRLLDRLGIPYKKSHPLSSDSPGEISFDFNILRFDSNGKFQEALSYQNRINSKTEKRNEKQISDFVRASQKLIEAGFRDDGIDFIHSVVDEHFRSGRFLTVEKILDQIDPEEFDTCVLISLLTATFPARSKLKNRNFWYEKSKEAIRKRPEWEERLLDGLQRMNPA